MSAAGGGANRELGIDDRRAQLDLAQLRVGDRVERVEELDDTALAAAIGTLRHRTDSRQPLERVRREPRECLAPSGEHARCAIEIRRELYRARRELEVRAPSL